MVLFSAFRHIRNIQMTLLGLIDGTSFELYKLLNLIVDKLSQVKENTVFFALR